MKINFSVIMSTYNRTDKILEAVKSVLDQSYQDFELIIVNDGSTEDYSEFESYIQDLDKVKYYYKENEERSVARNYGIERATGNFIVFIDDDDIYYPNHLEVFVEAILDDELAGKQYFYRTLMHTKTDAGEITSEEIPGQMVIRNCIDEKGNQDIMLMKFGLGYVCFPKFMFDEFKFIPELYYAEDMDLWIRMNQKYDLKIIPVCTYVARIHGNNTVGYSEYSMRGNLRTLLYWKENYPSLDFSGFNSRVANLALGIVPFEVKKTKKEALNLLFMAARHNLKLITTRRFWGAVRLLLF